jgi:N utilization substance protein B
MTRHEKRAGVFTLLYEYTFYEGDDPSEFISSREEMNESAYDEFIKDTFLSTVSDFASIDKKIAEYAVGWKVKRMSKVTVSILRLAVYELLFTDTPPKAVINEAVELSKEYDEEKAPAFINGILNKLARGEGRIAEMPGNE